MGVRWGVSGPAPPQPARDREGATARLSASQARSKCHRCRLQASRVSRVSRIPCEKTFWFAALIAYSIGSGGRGFESARSVFPLELLRQRRKFTELDFQPGSNPPHVAPG